MISILQRAWAVAAREIDADVLLLAVALTLLAVGFWQSWRPGAALIPGLVLLWIVLPSRRSFVVRGPDVEVRPATRGRSRDHTRPVTPLEINPPSVETLRESVMGR